MDSLHVLPLPDDTLRRPSTDQRESSRLHLLVHQNQWAFVAYTGSRTQTNTSQWYAIKPGRWLLVRHQLESFGPELVQQEALGGAPTSFNGRPSNTFIRGYRAYVHQTILRSTNVSEWPKRLLNCMARQNLELTDELKGTDYVAVNSFVLCVRQALPVGARPFVPLEERSRWALLQRDLDSDPDNDRAREALRQMRLEHEDKFHAADRPIGHIVMEHPAHVVSEHSWTIPQADYICSRCKKVGHHMNEACEILNPTFERLTDSGADDAPVAVMWGPKKFGGAMKRTSNDDAAYYALMHKRHCKM